MLLFREIDRTLVAPLFSVLHPVLVSSPPLPLEPSILAVDVVPQEQHLPFLNTPLFVVLPLFSVTLSWILTSVSLIIEVSI
jgi:hypothetical protein